MTFKPNTIVQGDCVELMRQLPAACFAYSQASCPFDDLFTYGGLKWNFKETANELHRLAAPGGIVCWETGEKQHDFSASGSSSEQRSYFKKIGFKLMQRITLINHGRNTTCKDYYGLPPKEVFVLLKGKRPKYVNLQLRPAKHAGRIRDNEMRKRPNGNRKSARANNPKRTNEFVPLSAYWEPEDWGFWDYATGAHTTDITQQEWLRGLHPCIMNEYKQSHRLPFMALRKTGSTLVGNHDGYRDMRHLYLGNLPDNINDTHYVESHYETFARATDWLREEVLGTH